MTGLCCLLARLRHQGFSLTPNEAIQAELAVLQLLDFRMVRGHRRVRNRNGVPGREIEET